jgi:hypothetical protein
VILNFIKKYGQNSGTDEEVLNPYELKLPNLGSETEFF